MEPDSRVANRSVTMPTDNLNDVQQDIESYLVSRVSDGKQYFKSKYIADDLDLSPKSVGTNLGILQDKSSRVVIKSWSSGSSGITWLITHAEEYEFQESSRESKLAVVGDD